MNLDKSEMLSKFFLAQWESPVALDWTLEVHKNLVQKLGMEKFWVLNLFGHKEIWSKNVFVQKIWSKKSWGPNALGQTELLSKKK